MNRDLGSTPMTGLIVTNATPISNNTVPYGAFAQGAPPSEPFPLFGPAMCVHPFGAAARMHSLMLCIRSAGPSSFAATPPTQRPNVQVNSRPPIRFAVVDGVPPDRGATLHYSLAKGWTVFKGGSFDFHCTDGLCGCTDFEYLVSAGIQRCHRSLQQLPHYRIVQLHVPPCRGEGG